MEDPPIEIGPPFLVDTEPISGVKGEPEHWTSGRHDDSTLADRAILKEEDNKFKRVRFQDSSWEREDDGHFGHKELEWREPTVQKESTLLSFSTPTCEQCTRRQVACNGTTPRCTPCASRRIMCTYPSDHAKDEGTKAKRYNVAGGSGDYMT
ncbi:hypothetical protein C8T65DRAFT_139858 [Cerioporus squamosus]|nr:hypothetical protein C8T65DRAFT_139858 [Cerioporus squamosus]